MRTSREKSDEQNTLKTNGTRGLILSSFSASYITSLGQSRIKVSVGTSEKDLKDTVAVIPAPPPLATEALSDDVRLEN